VFMYNVRIKVSSRTGMLYKLKIPQGRPLNFETTA
jgi:hypothetical protein